MGAEPSKEVEMSRTCRSRIVASLAVALLFAGAAAAQDDQCPKGAVNTITGNYTGQLQDPKMPASLCEICVYVRVQTGDGAESGTWEDIGRVCDIWSDQQAYDVMFRIGRCGLIVPSADGAAAFYGTMAPIRARGEYVYPCVAEPQEPSAGAAGRSRQ